MIDKMFFIGGLNSDDEDRALPDGDYRYALNIRNSRGDKSSLGSIENARGNTKIPFILPVGINKAMGNRYDEKNNRHIFFIWNSLSNHSIYEFNNGSLTVTLLMQDPVFNFNRDYPILHIEIIDDLCYWTDEFNPERKINIARAKSGGYTTIDEQVISRIQYAPNYAPITQYGSDINTAFNRVRGKMFQFKYAYVYDDNEISAYSPVSKIAIPSKQSLYDFGGYYEATIDNFISIEVNAGNYLCKRIKIAVRESNTADWYLAKEIERIEIANSPTFTYNFYNNEVLVPLSQAEVNRLFDNVPLKTGALALIDGNRLVSSDITEGFDNITLLASATPVYNATPPPITSLVKGYSLPWGTNITINSGDILESFGTPTTHPFNPVTQIVFIDANTVNSTDIWNLSCSFEIKNALSNPYSAITSFKDSFSEQFPVGTTSFDIAVRFMNLITASTQLNGNVSYNGVDYKEIIISGYPTYTKAYLRTEVSFAFVGGNIELSITYKGFAVSAGTSENAACQAKTSVSIDSNIVVKTFKKNSRGSFAIVYYDNANRSGVCQISDSFDVTILPYFNLLNKGSVEMDITILSIPPSWAKFYQILYTGNRSVSSYLQIDTGSVSISTNQLKIYINTIAGYNTLSGGRANLSYSWAKGDRVTFIGYGANLYFNELYDLEIISSSSDTGGQYIMVDNVLPVSLTNGTLIELYTPRLSQEQILYWEIGEVYPVENGFHAGDITQIQTSSVPAIIRVNSGDSYFRYRGYNTDSFIEDYSLSDYYTSNSWDKGRFNVVDKEYKQIRRYATSVYSESYIPDTNINGLSTVYDTNVHEATKTFGPIQRIYAEQDRLLFCQETRTGFSLINKDVLYNADGTPNGVLGKQNVVIGAINYYEQPYGIGKYPESFCTNGTRKYFIEPTEGYVLRLSTDGFTEISSYKYFNFFQEKFNARKKISQLFHGKIWGAYDVRFDTYVLSFEDCSKPDGIIATKEGTKLVPGEVVIPGDTIAFFETKNRWVEHYSWIPELMSSNGIDLVSFKNGELFIHNSSNTYGNFYGVQYPFVIETVSNDNPSVIKNFLSIFLESTNAWDIKLTNQFGQESELLESDFELNEGVYYAALLKDKNTPNITDPLIEGDDMRCHSMTIRLTGNSTDFVRLFSINIRYTPSELTNK